MIRSSCQTELNGIMMPENYTGDVCNDVVY